MGIKVGITLPNLRTRTPTQESDCGGAFFNAGANDTLE